MSPVRGVPQGTLQRKVLLLFNVSSILLILSGEPEVNGINFAIAHAKVLGFDVTVDVLGFSMKFSDGIEHS